MEDQYIVGAILDSSWGYDQTNIDFYRIERRTRSTVWLRPLDQVSTDGPCWATGNAIPTLTPKAIGAFEVGSPGGRWNGTLIRRTLKYHNGKCIGLSIKHGWASLWDGKPAQWTGYA